MKKFALLFFVFLFSISSIAQDKAVFSEIVETNISKDIMWLNLKKWVSSEFNSYEHVVDLEDKENGVIIIKWKNPTILYPSEFLKLIISSTIEVDVKDNKFRYIVSGGQVNVSPNIGDPSRMATSSIYLAQNDINFVLGLINNNEKIIIDNDFVDKVNNYKQKVDSLPKYKNEKKNKLSDDWEDANRKYQILNNMFATFKETNQALVNSLKEALVANDNW